MDNTILLTTISIVAILVILYLLITKLKTSKQKQELQSSIKQSKNTSTFSSTPSTKPTGSGKYIGQYKVIKVLGQGATSKVYLVEKDNKLYAAKLFQSEDPELLERFKREVEILKQIKHVNIVQIFDYGEHEGKPYLILEYVEGKTLDEVYHDLTLIQKIDVILAISNALNYLHNKGIIHRDIKPENILVHTNIKNSKLTDLGISRIVYWKPITYAGQILGTPSYMAPELFEGVYTDPKIDIYSLGITMYEIFTGKLPFEGNASEVIIKHMKETPTLPTLINPQIPTQLEKIIMKCIEKKPERRYKSVSKLIEDLIFVKESLKNKE
ncbi:MAG: serine/threonine-protein kinase [bacterium]